MIQVMNKTLLSLSALFAVGCQCLPAAPDQTVTGVPAHEVKPVSFTDKSADIYIPRSRKIKNVIYMIGDGMGSEHVWAAWLCNRGKLYLESLPVCGFSRTMSASHTITDSAAGGTALACGVKTRNGQLGMTADGYPAQSLAAIFHRMGKATGVVVTKAITDATPSSFYAHRYSRQDTAGIAQDLTDSPLQVISGGGAANVSPEQQQAIRERGAHLSLSAPKDCPPASRRGNMLEKETAKALAVLEKDPDGFFLMIEGSSIDVAGHANDLREVVCETLDFDRTIGLVLEWMEKNPDTLLVITADHQTGGLSILDGCKKAGKVRGVFTTTGHSGVAVPVYAAGPGSRAFAGIHENTELPALILKVAAPAQSKDFPRTGKSPVEK